MDVQTYTDLIYGVLYPVTLGDDGRAQNPRFLTPFQLGWEAVYEKVCARIPDLVNFSISSGVADLSFFMEAWREMIFDENPEECHKSIEMIIDRRVVIAGTSGDDIWTTYLLGRSLLLLTNDPYMGLDVFPLFGSVLEVCRRLRSAGRDSSTFPTLKEIWEMEQITKMDLDAHQKLRDEARQAIWEENLKVQDAERTLQKIGASLSIVFPRLQRRTRGYDPVYALV
ncbi:MAG: hypothetical protein Q9225_008092 [Loekoesia sp. 1 TL-2023]